MGIGKKVQTLYQERGHGCKSQGLVAPKVSVAEESSDYGDQIGAAIEDIEQGRGRDALHVEDCS